jgi:hypothetical protein
LLNKKSFHRRAAIAALLAAAGVLYLSSGQQDRSSAVRATDEARKEQAPGTGGSQAVESTIADPLVDFSVEDFCASARVEQWSRDLLALSGDSREAYAQIESDTAARLSSSRDPAHLHAAALLDKAAAGMVEVANGAQDADPDSPARQVAWISRALDADPDNPLHLWGAVQICMTASAEWKENRAACPLGEWQARLLEVDPQNREVWAYAAVNLLAAGDESGALEAMQKAGALAESRVYWPETVEMLERSLQAATDWPFMARATEAFGVASRTVVNELRPMSLCRDQSEVSREWAYACLAYGQRNELDPPMERLRQVAVALQQYALSALDEEDQLAQLDARWLGQRQRRLEVAQAIGSRAVAVAVNPTLFARFLQLVRELGEFDAQIAFDREAQAWVNRHQGADCVP